MKEPICFLKYKKFFYCFLIDIVGYILKMNVTLKHGETIGFSAEQKLKITRIVISVITILIVWFVPFTNIMLAQDFKVNLREREKVVVINITGVN
ncbi:MAG: DUF4261 domain-containing protein [Clostridiaceae bacterium]|nr:DUF4261 domain-containing protein [Clostridiaceae bacterium]